MNNLLNLKSFLNFLGRHKAYTAIDVFGLSVSLMFVILIAVYTLQETSVDKFHEKGDRIYALGNGNNFGTAYRIAGHIESKYPEIEMVCPLAPWDENTPVTVADQRYSAAMLFADSTFFKMFSFPLINGRPDDAMKLKDYAVISESFARRVFPGADPLGQLIQVNDSVRLTVNGVMKDIKNSVFASTDIILRMDNIKYFNPSMDSETFNNAGSAYIFILERPGADLRSKAEDMAAFFKDDLQFWMYKRGIYDKVTFTPVKEFYFSPLESNGGLKHGDKSFVLILTSVGILILLFAVINYINLTVAQTGFRAKEMATRRLLGSSRGELFMRLIMESTLITFASFLTGLLFAYAVCPVANNLLQTRMDLTAALTPVNTGICVLLILALGFISGLLPAFLISNAKPVDVVRGSFRRRTKMVFSKLFITFQNVITIMLIAASITMVWQIKHMINAPLGYNYKNHLYVPVFQFDTKERFITFGNEAGRLSSVNRVAYSQGIPFNRGNNWTVDYDGRSVSFQILVGDETFFDLLGLQKIRENNVASNDAYYLTEQALKETELAEGAESFKLGGYNPAVAGIIKDFHLYNITYPMRPTLYRMGKIENFYPWNLLLEVTGDPNAAFRQVKEVYERLTGLEFTGQYVGDMIEESFEPQRRTAKIVMIFCAIAILISLLGLLAMSTYFIQQRYREIGVRKVFGSTNREVLIRLVGAFLRYVLTGFVIATPVVWYIMHGWLSDYSYRIPLSPLIFIAAGIFCLVISFLVVYWQSYRAASENPVNSLKAE